MIGYGTGKIIFEIPAFLPIERGISGAGKFKVMLHLAATEMCLFSFEFELPAVEVPRSKFKKVAISKYFFLFRTLSYITLGNIKLFHALIYIYPTYVPLQNLFGRHFQQQHWVLQNFLLPLPK